eukprot:248145_1
MIRCFSPMVLLILSVVMSFPAVMTSRLADLPDHGMRCGMCNAGRFPSESAMNDHLRSVHGIRIHSTLYYVALYFTIILGSISLTFIVVLVILGIMVSRGDVHNRRAKAFVATFSPILRLCRISPPATDLSTQMPDVHSGGQRCTLTTCNEFGDDDRRNTKTTSILRTIGSESESVTLEMHYAR